MRRETVHEDGSGGRLGEKRGVHLVRGEDRATFGRLAFLAHGGPHVGVDRVG